MKTLVLCIVLMVSMAASFSQEVTLQELLEQPHQYHNQGVVIEAEAIGEVLKGKNGLWINVAQEGYQLGIFIDRIMLSRYPFFEKITFFGSYHRQGDIIRVEGTFYDNCPIHFTRDIHATRITVKEKGKVLQENVSERKKDTFAILAIICLTLAGIYFIKVRYASRGK